MKLLKSRDLLAIIGIIAFSFFAVKPLLAPGFFSMHDDTQIARVFTMSEALKDGQFPVRVVEHLGYDYGYTIFNFYAPFSYYFGALFVLFGFPPVVATKLMIGIGIIAAGIFMYMLAKEFWGRVGGVIAGVMYIYAPYHAVNAYVRGAIGEMWAYAFIPLLFFGLYKIYQSTVELHDIQKKRNRRSLLWKYIGVTAVGYAGIILSHNLTAMMVTPFIGLVIITFLFLFAKRKKIFHIRYPVYAVLLGLGLSAFYFLPALFEMKYADVGSVLGGGSDFRDHFLCPIQYWYSPWGYGGSVPGCLDGLSFQLGKPHILFTFFTLFLSPWVYLKNRYLFYVLSFIFICLGFVLFLMLPGSKFLWEILAPMEYFQFPWRFLVLASFFMSFLAGGTILLERVDRIQKLSVKNISLAIAGVCFVAIVGFYGKFFTPQFIIDSPEDQANPEIVRFDVSRISDEYLPKGIPQPQSSLDVPTDKIQIIDGSATLSTITSKSQILTVGGTVEEPTTILIQKAYFPAWKLYLNGKEHSFTVVDGKIQTRLPEGPVDIQLIFGQTQLEKTANTISFISLLILGTGIIMSRKKLNIS